MILFQAADKTYWCKRPSNLNIDIGLWRNLSETSKNCEIPLDRHWTNITNFTVIKCTEWEFSDTDNIGNTWISEWKLVCDKEYLKNVAEMFFLVGVATGGIISGYFSDKFGRKTMLFISVLLQTIFGE